MPELTELKPKKKEKGMHKDFITYTFQVKSLTFFSLESSKKKNVSRGAEELEKAPSLCITKIQQGITLLFRQPLKKKHFFKPAPPSLHYSLGGSRKKCAEKC